MSVVYLDWNIIVGFVRNELPASLKERLVSLRRNGAVSLPPSMSGCRARLGHSSASGYALRDGDGE